MFTMSKFNKEQKIEIYHKWKDEKISISQLSKTYKTNVANLDYMLRLINMYWNQCFRQALSGLFYGYNVIIKQKGRPARDQRESKITQGIGERDPKAERRKLAIAYCERIRKKTEGLGSRQRSREIAKAITDLRHEFKVSLNYVLDAIAEHPELPTIARSSYYKIIKRKAQAFQTYCKDQGNI